MLRWFTNRLVARRALTPSPRAWFDGNAKAYVALNLQNVQVNGERLALPPDVIGVVFVYGTRERAEARNPDTVVLEVVGYKP